MYQRMISKGESWAGPRLCQDTTIRYSTRFHRQIQLGNLHTRWMVLLLNPQGGLCISPIRNIIKRSPPHMNRPSWMLWGSHHLQPIATQLEPYCVFLNIILFRHWLCGGTPRQTPPLWSQRALHCCHWLESKEVLRYWPSLELQTRYLSLLHGRVHPSSPQEVKSSFPSKPHHSTHRHCEITYGSKQQLFPDEDTSPALYISDIRRFQGIVSSLLYYI